MIFLVIVLFLSSLARDAGGAESNAGASTTTLPTLEQVAEVLTYLGIKRPIVIGGSSSAKVRLL